MRRWIFGCAAFALGAAASMIAARGQAPGERAQEVAAIRAHIESIFQAFIDKDVARLQVTHGKNWRGFLTGSTKVIRGIDQAFNPVPAGARKPLLEAREAVWRAWSLRPAKRQTTGAAVPRLMTALFPTTEIIRTLAGGRLQVVKATTNRALQGRVVVAARCQSASIE